MQLTDYRLNHFRLNVEEAILKAEFPHQKRIRNIKIPFQFSFPSFEKVISLGMQCLINQFYNLFVFIPFSFTVSFICPFSFIFVCQYSVFLSALVVWMDFTNGNWKIPFLICHILFACIICFFS